MSCKNDCKWVHVRYIFSFPPAGCTNEAIHLLALAGTWSCKITGASRSWLPLFDSISREANKRDPRLVCGGARRAVWSVGPQGPKTREETAEASRPSMSLRTVLGILHVQTEGMMVFPEYKITVSKATVIPNIVGMPKWKMYALGRLGIFMHFRAWLIGVYL